MAYINGKEILFSSNVRINAEGGESTSGEYLVKVIDYDGTILKSARLDSGAIFTLPDTPSHSGLVFEEWSSPVDINNNTVTVDNNDIIIGAVYHTESGKSEFDIELTKATGLDVTLNLDGERDWGDGTIDSLQTHTYSNYGGYTIKANTTEITTEIFGQSSTVPNYYCVSIRGAANITNISNDAFEYCYSLKTAIVPNGIYSMPRFSDCYSLETIIIPKSVIIVQDIDYCYSLKDIVIPNSVTYICSFTGCYSLETLIIPNSVTSLNESAYSTFSSCYSLKDIKIPSNITSLGNSAFSRCYGIITYDFSQCTSIPTLASTNVFDEINSIAKIIVPDGLYENWISDTNWATYANYIYKVSEAQND